MNRSFIIVILTGLFFTGCIGFYPPTDPSFEFNAKQDIKEQRIQDSIEKYILERTPPGYHYNSLEFGDLYVIKDAEIKKLDKLIEEMNYLPLEADKYSQEEFQKKEKKLQEDIDTQKQLLKEKKIYPWYEINHLYALENLINDSVLVYEFDFEIYPNYSVKDVHSKMSISMDAKRYKMLKFFLNQSPVYSTGDWMYNEKMNNEFYTAALAALGSETEYKDKLLLTIVDMTQYIYDRNEFDENDFAKKQMLRWEKENVQEQLKTISMSKLKSTIDTLDGQPVLTGYVMTHDVYTESIDNKKRFSFSFDLNYVITKVTEQNKE